MTQIVSSISGIEIYAPSAGFAPTNSADVSAIASGYQVVSSTSTELYAGTAFLTGVNGAPVSASRAGNAANAGMANSAYYDGTGRLISSLPDETTVSSIASSYAESAASGKLDSTAQVVSALTTEDAGGGVQQVNSINGMELSAFNSYWANAAGRADYAGSSTTAYCDDNGRELTSLAQESSISSIASSYAESAASSKADSSSLSSYALSADVSGVIDTVSSNSASWGGGGATGDYVEKSATEVSIGSANVASSASFAQGVDNTASSNSFAQGSGNSAILSAFAQGIGNTSRYYALAQGKYNSADSATIAQGSSNKAYQVALSLGIKNTALYNSIALGTGNSANSDAFALGRDNKANGVAFTQGRANTASYTSFAQGYYNSAKNNNAVFGQYNLRGDGDTATGNSAAFAIGDGTASGARHDLMLVTKDGEITMYSSTADTAGTGIMSSIRAISAAATGGGGDYLTSKVGSGRATFTTAFQDGMDKRPALCINGERGVDSAVYPRMLITDWNRSTGDTHSGTLLANAFEFYTCPTSARGEVDPSGVLLARLDDNKVEFYFDSSVTSKNRSAHYGRGGVFLGVSGASGSSIQIVNEMDAAPYIVLDDNSGVTGRIEPSSMGYWNNKLDGSASSSFYTTANESAYVDSAYVESQVSSVIGTVSSNSASWSGGVDSATVSAIASAYAESAASGKQRSGSYISAAGFKQAIHKTTSTASQYIMFGGPPENTTSNAKAGIWLSGEFGTAYYKDNELNLNRNNMKIAFNIGGAGPKISSMATGAMHSYMYLFASGNNSATYSDTGIEFKDSGNSTVALYDSATYGNITSVVSAVSSNSASWNGKMDSSAVQSAYASASATQATASNVLYILLPDGA